MEMQWQSSSTKNIYTTYLDYSGEKIQFISNMYQDSSKSTS